MKHLFILVAIVLCLSGCKYNDDYLNPRLDKTVAYFASASSYTRTLIVGEGLYFKIGAAMAGVKENTQDEFVYMFIPRDPLTGDKELLPKEYYNSSDLNGVIEATIPKGEFLGYFTVKMDSIKFLNDPESLNGRYALPVKLVDTSLESINTDLNSILVTIKYMSGVDGYYLYESTIKKEVGGSIVEEKTEKYPNESDNSVWRLETKAPFTVQVSPSVNSSINGIKFNLTVKENKVTYESVEGQPVVEAEGSNTYDSKTRDFELNFKYQDNEAVYHVSTKLIFRNRLVDNFNQTREYLSYFNK